MDEVTPVDVSPTSPKESGANRYPARPFLNQNMRARERTHTRARARTHARTHAHTHAQLGQEAGNEGSHTHTRTHTHTHTRTHVGWQVNTIATHTNITICDPLFGYLFGLLDRLARGMGLAFLAHALASMSRPPCPPHLVHRLSSCGLIGTPVVQCVKLLVLLWITSVRSFYANNWP